MNNDIELNYDDYKEYSATHQLDEVTNKLMRKVFTHKDTRIQCVTLEGFFLEINKNCLREVFKAKKVINQK